tara:strand:- start:147 stop:491 length:345 start_codon:yes stop_codon:yes gene_type:complete
MNNFIKNNNFIIISVLSIPAVILRWQIDQILIVNIIGCFLLGFINSLTIPKKYKLIFGFGFCGSLTTFSGWSLQLFELIKEGFYKLFFLNSIFIVMLGFIAVGLGHFVARKIVG